MTARRRCALPRNHGYFRLRDEGYTTPDLEKWADRLVEQSSAWEDAFVYFKHEDAGKGPEFARAFCDILSRRGHYLQP